MQKMNSLLLTQMEDLAREGQTKEEFEQEVQRAKSMAALGKVLVESAKAESTFLKGNGYEGQPHSMIAPTKQLES